MTAKAQNIQLSFVGSFIGSMLPVLGLAFYLGGADADLRNEIKRGDEQDRRLLALENPRVAIDPPAISSVAVVSHIKYEELPRIANTGLPIY